MPEKITKAKLSKHLDPLVHIRTRPGMYITHVQNPIVITREIIDNAIDEVMVGAAKNIWVTIHNDNSISVRDDGRGMPVTPIEVNGKMMPNARASWTVPNTGSHYDLDRSSTSSGTHGLGSKTTLATSDKFTGEVWLDNKYYYDEYIYDPESGQPGVPQVALKDDGSYTAHRQTPDNTPENFTHGTRVRFWPSEDVFDTTILDWEWLKKHMHQQAYLHNGLTTHIINEYDNQSIDYYEKDGLKAYLQTLIDASDGQPITQIHEFTGEMNTETSRLTADVAFVWTNSRNITQIGVTNSVNNHQGGTHIDGFNTGIMKLLNKYADKLGLSKDTLEARDTRPGLIAVVNVTYSEPMYNSQTKDLLTNPEVKQDMNKITVSQAQFELDKYIQDVQAIIKQAVARADARKNVDDLSKIKLDNKSLTMQVSEKLSPAKKTGPSVTAELYIVEGDSASGGLKRTRIQDPVSKLYQAIMPIRGKIINAAKATPAKVFENTEIATIITALGAGYGKDFNESKLNYDKLIIATDADADGAQIAELLRMFFFKYMRPLIENGHVYRVMSPLYINLVKDPDNKGKTKDVYTYDQNEQDAFLSKTDEKDIKEIRRYKGLGEMNDPLVKKTMIMPGSRRLIQFTVDDFDSAFENADLFMGKEVAPRREYLFENAEFAEILDID